MISNSDLFRYIIQFLCVDASIDVEAIFSYCKKEAINPDKKIIVISSGFFDQGVYGTKASEPQLPLSEIEGIPLLFGEARIEQKNGQVIIYADLIASAYFLLTRYEELIKPDIRDKHGRFIGQESLPYQAGFIDRPIVDEYGKLLRKYLRLAGIDIAEPKQGFSNIYLTHDIDVPWSHFTLYQALKRIMALLLREHRLNFYPLRNYFGNPTTDPVYSFESLIQMDQTVPKAKSVYFIKSGGTKRPEDGYIYIQTKQFKDLLERLISNKSILGYHASYEAGLQPSQMQEELNILNKICGKEIIYNRNHYLGSREPKYFRELIKLGITDDFTMGYADVAGFRLGTCRPVRWIDPENRELTKLILHPLTMMEATLTSEKYMKLNKADSQDYGLKLLEATLQHGGEAVLLWHNNSYIGNVDSIDWANYIFFTNYLRNKQEELPE